MHETMQSKKGELGCDQVWFYIFMSNHYHRQLLLYYLSFSNVQDINVALIVMSQVNKRFLPILLSCVTLYISFKGAELRFSLISIDVHAKLIVDPIKMKLNLKLLN